MVLWVWWSLLENLDRLLFSLWFWLVLPRADFIPIIDVYVSPLSRGLARARAARRVSKRCAFPHVHLTFIYYSAILRVHSLDTIPILAIEVQALSSCLPRNRSRQEIQSRARNGLCIHRCIVTYPTSYASTAYCFDSTSSTITRLTITNMI